MLDVETVKADDSILRFLKVSPWFIYNFGEKKFKGNFLFRENIFYSISENAFWQGVF